MKTQRTHPSATTPPVSGLPGSTQAPLDPGVVLETLHETGWPMRGPEALPTDLHAALTDAVLGCHLAPGPTLRLLEELPRLTRGPRWAGLCCILPAYGALLERAVIRYAGTDTVQGGHATLFRQLVRVVKSAQGATAEDYLLGRPPLYKTDPVGYFLWRACLDGPPPAAPALLPLIRDRLFSADRNLAYKTMSRLVADRLPYELAMAVRHFPETDLPCSQPTYASLAESFRRFRERRSVSEKTETDYLQVVTRFLGVQPPPDVRLETGGSSAWPHLRRLGYPADREGFLEVEDTEAGELCGLLAYPVPATDPSRASEEEADWTVIPGARRWLRPLARAAWYRLPTDGSVPTPNELARVLATLQRSSKQGKPRERIQAARFGFGVTAVAFTGLPPARVFHAWIWPGDPERLPAVLQSARDVVDHATGELVVIVPAAGLLLCTDRRFVRPGVEAVRVGDAWLAPVPLPALAWALATEAWPGPSVPQLQRAFPRPHDSAKGTDFALVSPLLFALSQEARLLEPLTWSKLRGCFRTYLADMCGSPLFAELTSGVPTWRGRVEWSYVSYRAQQAVDECQAAQEAIVDRATGIATTIEGFPLIATPPVPGRVPRWMADMRLGAEFHVEDADVRVAWASMRAAIASAPTPAATLNRLTLAVASFLIAGAGIRELELDKVGTRRTHRLDLDAGLVRLGGKSGYFDEVREVPLNPYVCAELCGYRREIERLYPHLRRAHKSFFWLILDGELRAPGPGDLGRVIAGEGLAAAWGFHPRTLRHWLRTKLEQARVPWAVVNDCFGHTSETDTVWHELAGEPLGPLHDAYRAATAAALRSVVDEERLARGVFSP